MSAEQKHPSDDLSRPKTVRQYLRLYLTGFAMGSADIVPGVSGGTMAFILGFYEDLLNGIKAFNLDVLRLVVAGKFKEALDKLPLLFLITLGLGILTALLSLARGLSWMLDNEPELLFSFFFGLVVASIIAVGVRIERWSMPVIAGLLVGTVVAFIIVGLTPAEGENHSTPVLFFSGMVAIMAMILPGISGSFILLLLGQYKYVLNAVKDFDIATVLTVGLGALIGIIGFSRVLSWLLRKYEQLTLAILTGFMIGSLRKIYPFREAIPLSDEAALEHAQEFTRAVMPDFSSTDFYFALALCILGFVIVSVLDHMQSKSNPAVLFVQRMTGMQKTTTKTSPVSK